jgi:hypothetical protein
LLFCCCPADWRVEICSTPLLLCRWRFLGRADGRPSAGFPRMGFSSLGGPWS